ncbi:MAG: glycosyltransferase family 4 protein [Nitrospirota bacterium]
MDTVCHVITKLELGGAQEVALFTVSHLDRARFRPALVTGPDGLLTAEAKALSGVDVQVLPPLRREIRPLHDLLALIQLVRLFRKLRPTIVHTHSSKAGILGRWAAWFARVPVVVHTVHGYGVTPRQPAWLRKMLVGLERFTGRVTTHWVAVSKADIEQGLRWGLFTRERVSLVRPGIDPRPFSTALSDSQRHRLRAEVGVQDGELLVGTVACLKPQKAPLDFVAVAARVCRRLPSVRFVLVGDGELREPVEAAIRKAGLQERLRLLGWRRDVPALMQALDVFLLTSHWEGLPRVLLEARASGLPVVATRVGGSEEAIVEGEHGWLCRAGDVDGMAQRVCRVLEDAGRRSRLRVRRDPLPQEFEIHEMVRQYEALYGQLRPGSWSCGVEAQNDTTRNPSFVRRKP